MGMIREEERRRDGMRSPSWTEGCMCVHMYASSVLLDYCSSVLRSCGASAARYLYEFILLLARDTGGRG